MHMFFRSYEVVPAMSSRRWNHRLFASGFQWENHGTLNGDDIDFFSVADGEIGHENPMGTLHSYWKWPFIVSFPIKNGDFP
jgi:hypothetical protein